MSRRKMLERLAVTGGVATAAAAAERAIDPDTALANGYAVLGDDGTVGGTNGSPLNGSVVRDSSFDGTSPISAAASPRNRALRDFVSVKDYGATGNGTTDDTSALLTATQDAASKSRKLWMPSGTYLVSNTITQNPSALVVEGEDPATSVIKMSASFPQQQIITSTGSLGGAVAVTAQSSPADTTVTVASTTGWNQGDMLLLRDSTQPVYGIVSGSRGVASVAGEYAMVRSTTTTTVTFYGQLEFGYSTSADVRKLNPISIKIAELGFINSAPGTQQSGSGAITLNYFYDVQLHNLEFTDMDTNMIGLQWGTDFTVSDTSFYKSHDLEIPNAPYCIIISKAAHHGLVEHVRSRYGRHVVTTGGVAATEVGQAHVKVADSIATEHSGAAFDVHPGARRFTFDNVSVHNQNLQATDGTSVPGIQIRGPDCDVINPTIVRAPIGIQFIYGADRARLVGGRVVGCTTGVNVQDSDDCYVGGGVLIDSPTINGIETQLESGWTMTTGLALGTLVITGTPTNALNNAAACPLTFTT